MKHSLNHPRILVVEDEVIVARDIREQLVGLGYDVVADTTTGEAAIELTAQLRPNLVLMDVRLAGAMDGIAAAQIIRDRFTLPVVFLTAYAGDEMLRRAKLAEPFGYIIKPFDDRELRTVVEMALYKHGAEARLRASEQKLRMIVEHSTQLFYSHTPDNVLTYVSPQAREFFDCEPDEALRNWTSFLTDHPANAEGVALTRTAIESGQRQRPYPLELRSARGRTSWVEVRESPVVVDGKTAAIVGALTDITASKQAQDQLRLLSAALTAAANAIMITDCEGTIVWVNAAFCHLTGYAVGEALGKNPRDLVKSGKGDRDVYQNLWETILAGKVWSGELVNRRKDGSLYCEEQTITPVRDASGKIAHFIAVKQDLTERRAVELMVQASRQQFQAVFEQAAAGMMIVEGPLGKFLTVNRRFCEMVGYSAAELRELSCIEITHPDDVAADRVQFEQIVAGTIREFNHEKRCRRKDGSDVWGSLFVASIDPSAKRPGPMIGVVIDITERKKAEEALRQSEERYRLLFDHAPDCIYSLAPTGAFTALNRAFETITGWPRADWIGRSFQELVHPEDLERARERFQSVLEGAGPAANFELRLEKAGGGYCDLEITGFASRQGDGSVEVSGIGRDITEKKLFEERFLHAQRLESIGLLAAGIAHDLNNVLTPIVFAAPMLRETLTSDRDSKILDTLEHCADRGAGLVKQILGFVHNSSGELGPTQVKHLIRDIVSVVEETFPKNIQLEHEIPSNLWLVSSNATQIHQIILNLCVNARDAMPGGGTLRIVASNTRLDAAAAAALPGARPGDWLEIEVTDTGTGIAPEVLARIWEPFFTTKAAGKGTGLGLSTVRGIAASHQGFVALHTAVGAGTTFRVFLPAVETEPARPGGGSSFELPPCQGELILVVDDDPAIRDIVAAILLHHGYRVVSCRDGIEAMSEFSRRPGEFSAVVTDVDMPRLGGVALARALLQLRPEIRLLAISGLSPSESGTSDVPAVRELVHAFLLKPFLPEDLLRAMHRLLHAAEGV